MSTVALSRSPVSLEDLELLKKTLLLGDEDVKALRASRPILEDQCEAILDVWYGFVGSQPHLLRTFANPRTGAPEGAYLAAVRVRFRQWILDTADARFDQAFLDRAHEIGLRHHRAKKNQTDGASAVDHVPWRWIPALTMPVTLTLEPFLAKKGAAPALVTAMQRAWTKSVLLQVILWSEPYVKAGDF